MKALQLELNLAGSAIGNFLLVHGPQGNLESDKYAWLSKLFCEISLEKFSKTF